ncbi:hypothetical protein PHYSODRAFT_332854 [Phytophthora sojae]|uniref:Uncharacterized protein n=1 Tax=Phytophthora sojae (strain P6497) TaxID=1094619 RepID=G4ZJY3_PHYSP|nr:hypothetical protein PHYSODRAFT_332854 [Phytophthora sojae]EGZ14465.1 hypothetical protein PHYSODRAFT_332854 [Phytophthora sojae]|eukprot:XP_009528214.1 hypothetical protein PHYSODRAFT_332854 [Phytophthora sojae]
MSVLTKREKTVPGGLEKFSGKHHEYATWKDKLLTHVAQLDLEAENKLLEAGDPDPKEIMVWRKADAAMRHVLNSTLPNSFLSSLPDEVRNMEVCLIWQHLERKFAFGDAGGLVAWSNRWTQILNSNWKDTMALFSLFNQAQNEMNRKSKKLLGKEMMTETMLCVQVLAQLPSEIWASSIELTEEAFTAEKVEAALNKLFGGRSRKQITGNGDATTVARINHVKSERAVRGYDTKKRKSDANTKRAPNGTKKIATVQHVAKKQRTKRDAPTDVEMEEEFKLPESENAGSEDENGGCLLSFGQIDTREVD